MSVQTLRVMTDEPGMDELLDATRAGEESAFATLVSRVQRRVRQWAGRFIADEDEADDIAQDVMIDLQRKVSQFRGESRFDTWLFTLTRSRALNHVRREKRRAGLLVLRDPADDNTPAAPDHDRQMLAEFVLACFDALPPRQRMVLEMVDLRGRSAVAVARELGLSPVTVRVHLLNARRTVRAKMIERHGTLVTEYYS